MIFLKWLLPSGFRKECQSCFGGVCDGQNGVSSGFLKSFSVWANEDPISQSFPVIHVCTYVDEYFRNLGILRSFNVARYDLIWSIVYACYNNWLYISSNVWWYGWSTFQDPSQQYIQPSLPIYAFLLPSWLQRSTYSPAHSMCWKGCWRPAVSVNTEPSIYHWQANHCDPVTVSLSSFTDSERRYVYSIEFSAKMSTLPFRGKVSKMLKADCQGVCPFLRPSHPTAETYSQPQEAAWKISIKMMFRILWSKCWIGFFLIRRVPCSLTHTSLIHTQIHTITRAELDRSTFSVHILLIGQDKVWHKWPARECRSSNHVQPSVHIPEYIFFSRFSFYTSLRSNIGMRSP